MFAHDYGISSMVRQSDSRRDIMLCLAPLATGLVPGFEGLQPLAVFMGLGMVFSVAGNLLLIPILLCRLEK